MSLELNYLIFYDGGSLLTDINQRTKRKDYCYYLNENADEIETSANEEAPRAPALFKSENLKATREGPV